MTNPPVSGSAEQKSPIPAPQQQSQNTPVKPQQQQQNQGAPAKPADKPSEQQK